MSLSRRQFLSVAGSATLLIPLGAACSGGANVSSGGGSGDDGGDESLSRTTAELPAAFSLPLAIPPVLAPSRVEGNTDYFDVTVRAAKLEILPGLQTEIWGYNGMFPGPTIQTRRGRTAVVRTRNELPVPMVTHLHGGRTPPESDGYPTDLILPVGGWTGHLHPGNVVDGTRDYTYPLDQRAATLWYHDHRMDFTGPQVWRGLAGMHLHRDDEDDALPLPRGERDIPLIVMDRTFDESGALAYPSIDPELRETPGVLGDFHNGVLGDVLLVNGVPWPFLEVEAARYRFRLLNACNSRRLRLRLDPRPAGGPAFVQVGSDGGLLEQPNALTSLYIVPAQRFDLVVDFSQYRPGDTVTLTNSLGDGSAGQVMQFRVTRAAADDSRVPNRLSSIERLDPANARNTRSFLFANMGAGQGQELHTINGRGFSTDFIAADPQLGNTEIWSLTSTTHHPIHIHLSPFQVLDRAGQPIPEDVGWKDVVRLTPNNEVKVLVRFDGFTGKYVLHCHNLEHEDMAMMANFQVV